MMAHKFLLRNSFGTQTQHKELHLLSPYRAPQTRRTKKSNSFHIDFQIDEKFYMRPAKLCRREQNFNDTQSLADKKINF